MERDSIGLVLIFLGVILSVAISWYLFEIVIQPALVSISPIFADQSIKSTGRVGRIPDTLAEAALFATILTGLYIFYLIEILIFEGVDEFIKGLGATLLIFAIPIFIINGILPERFQFIDEEKW
jgi:hypothetical protein